MSEAYKYGYNLGYSNWDGLFESRRSRIQVLEEDVSRRESEMSKEEAKMFLDYSTTLHEQLASAELLLLQSGDQRTLSNHSYKNALSLLQVLKLKKKLVPILSQAPSTEVTTPEPSSQSELQSLVKKQKFHIEQIVSFEINDDICPVKAQVSYEQVTKHYEWFTLNQAEINAQVDDAALADQKTITERIRGKVADIQVKLKKITTPEISEVDSLVKKSHFLIRQIKSLQSKSLVCANKAIISFNKLSSLYDSFLSNQMKIETQLTGDTLIAQQQISADVQQCVIESLTNFKKMFEPASVAVPLDFIQFQSTTTSSESGSTITHDTHEKIKRPDDIHSSENSSITTDDFGEHLDISRDIQSDVRSMKEKQKELQEDFKSIKDTFKSMEENLKSIKNDFKSMQDDSKSIRLEQKNTSLRSSSVNPSQTGNTDPQLEISRDTRSDMYSMKEKHKQLQDDWKSTQLKKPKSILSYVNSSQTVGFIGMYHADAPQDGIQSDYSGKWIEHYRAIGLHREAELIEAQTKAEERAMGGSNSSGSRYSSDWKKYRYSDWKKYNSMFNYKDPYNAYNPYKTG